MQNIVSFILTCSGCW